MVWSTAFTLEHEGRRLVARFGRHIEDFRKDERAATLYGLRIPVPRVLEIGEAFDGYVYAISEWMNGERIDQRILEPVSPSTIKPENKSFFDDQASFLKEAKPDFKSFNHSFKS